MFTRPAVVQISDEPGDYFKTPSRRSSRRIPRFNFAPLPEIDFHSKGAKKKHPLNIDRARTRYSLPRLKRFD